MRRQKLEIRNFRAEDLPEILAIQESSAQAAQWLPEHYTRLVADPAGILLVADLAAEDRESHAQNLESLRDRPAGRLAGFVAFHGIGDEAELENLAVGPEPERQGIAKRLVVAGHARLLQAGVRRVFLEVRASNVQALSLYASIGYAPTRVRKGYYRDPDEDACMLAVEL